MSAQMYAAYPLHAAALVGDHEKLATLLVGKSHPNDSVKKLDVDEREPSRGQTALHLAAANNHVECVRVLLQHGASVRVADKDGETPLALATRLKCEDVAGLMIARVYAGRVEVGNGLSWTQTSSQQINTTKKEPTENQNRNRYSFHDFFFNQPLIKGFSFIPS